ncbi:hypothetical protein VD0002_g8814 [Verticillium dahliae]|uniref:Formamidopyrimidine-DNA glycosylase catalytic domain-containing protein n=1 Tax=Verticillium dahliae TaxID=27337 RepID=A0AA44WMW1_VERDA|nr:formamidopyrimidine-DNA glycosylase [Verticillium dahliae]PNH33977.1 hypothetical protein BJF96_g2810 [Verticillium dahliae]PNH45516.1 hypothetical protein VD0003_g9204 [Verticillium dahliae]PNH58723.1 hypothetical protein VD0002_g8814 [Verticillium dahliae]
MPEIAEVARCVHFLRHHLVGKTIAKVTALEDDKVFGKVGTSGPAFEKAVQGRKVVSAGSQGKYFWLTFDQPPHAVMHLGMTGWVHIKGDKTAYTNYYKKMKPEEADHWPPKYWKFRLETEGTPKVEVAFTDPRRFGRVRLVDCPGDDIRKHTPLVENGPDPVVDVDMFTEEYMRSKMTSRHVPIKALLLDQTHISGIGNWVADEVLYQAKVHPEQYCDDFSDREIRAIYEKVRYVCQTAVDKLGDSDEFPEDWLFKYRWGKGGKDAVSKLPNGEKLAFITVGGRTSCYAPSRQQKTGRVVPSAKEEPIDAEPTAKTTTAKLKGRKNVKEVEPSDEDEKPPAKKQRGARTASHVKVEDVDGDTETPPLKKQKKTAEPSKAGLASSKPKVKQETTRVEASTNEDDLGRRRSGRIRKQT